MRKRMVAGRQIYSSCFCILLLFLIYSVLYYPSSIFSQTNLYNSERFTFPFIASNLERENALEYEFQDPILNDWTLFITNNITYSDNPEAKTVIHIKELPPSEKFIEITMFGDESKQFIVSANSKETGNFELYNNNENGWYADNPVALDYTPDIDNLSVSNGERMVIDRFPLDGFNFGSVNVYGKNDSSDPDNALNGSVEFEVIFAK